jgi:hypothetical protein
MITLRDIVVMGLEKGRIVMATWSTTAFNTT